MRTRPIAPLQYQVGDVAPAFVVRFEDSLIDPTELDVSFKLTAWFSNVVLCQGSAQVDGEVTSRTDAASGITYYSFSLSYEWAADDLSAAGTFFAQFRVDVDEGEATFPSDRGLQVRVDAAAVVADSS